MEAPWIGNALFGITVAFSASISAPAISNGNVSADLSGCTIATQGEGISTSPYRIIR